MAMARRAGTHGVVERFGPIVRRMAEVDTEDVNAGNKETLDHFRGGLRGSESRYDLDPPVTSHLSVFPCPAGSVRRMVHSFASPGSTSKNPVRLYARCAHSCTPRMAKDFSIVHMSFLPPHSPPRS